MIGLLFFIAIAARACGSLTRNIDKLLDTGVILKASVDQVLCSEGIHLKVGFFLHRFGDTCEMKNLMAIFHSLSQRGLITAVPGNDLDGKAFQPFQIAPFSHKAADLDASLEKRLSKMTSNKSCSSRYQSFQTPFSCLKRKNSIYFQSIVKENCKKTSNFLRE
jgi:hypothetical protein